MKVKENGDPNVKWKYVYMAVYYFPHSGVYDFLLLLLRFSDCERSVYETPLDYVSFVCRMW